MYPISALRTCGSGVKMSHVAQMRRARQLASSSDTAPSLYYCRGTNIHRAVTYTFTVC
jgi:hypothetical protein